VNVAYGLIAFMMTVVLAYLSLWAWMLADCLKNELPGSKDKTKWTLFMLLFGPFAGIVYSVGRRKKRIRELGR
jgi:hypothetical protein